MMGVKRRVIADDSRAGGHGQGLAWTQSRMAAKGGFNLRRLDFWEGAPWPQCWGQDGREKLAQTAVVITVRGDGDLDHRQSRPRAPKLPSSDLFFALNNLPA